MIIKRGHFCENASGVSSFGKYLDEVEKNDDFTKIRKENKKITVFLSHNNNDIADIKETVGVIEMLENYGAKIYIDCTDDISPNNIGNAAYRIKQKIQNCHKFILLATENAIESKWCNWELGIGDACKCIDNIAILPLIEEWKSDNQYVGNDYLLVYPSIYFKKSSNQKRDNSFYYIKYPNSNKIVKLDAWLKQN